jgi:hypothetical protein
MQRAMMARWRGMGMVATALRLEDDDMMVLVGVGG